MEVCFSKWQGAPAATLVHTRYRTPSYMRLAALLLPLFLSFPLILSPLFSLPLFSLFSLLSSLFSLLLFSLFSLLSSLFPLFLSS